MVVDGQITKNQFLTKSTTDLRVTILSTIQLSQCLLSCGFHYVLSNKFNVYVKINLLFFLYTILLLGFISTQCLIDMIPITD
jgi:hypothetical protein